jgi:hypothetical protein
MAHHLSALPTLRQRGALARSPIVPRCRPCGSGWAATYSPTTPPTNLRRVLAHRAPPCIWTFVGSLAEIELFSILLAVFPTD